MKELIIASSSISRHLSPRKMAFITGTLLLTSTGFICRILGFFYRIYMPKITGAEGLGVCSMVHPIFSIYFTVCAGSVQAALSQHVAANQARGKAVFKTGLVTAMGMSSILAWVIYTNSHFLTEKLLLEPRYAPYLPVMTVSVPFVVLHACINGYYYGVQEAGVLASSQVAEQAIRMDVVFLIIGIWLDPRRKITASLAVYGHLIGEMASAVFTLFCLDLFPPSGREEEGNIRKVIPLSSGISATPLMTLALPLMGNRLVLNVPGSAETIWIPSKLVSFSLTNSEALSIYDVLTSMALPFILFPSAIINSMAALLLPAVAEAQADGNEAWISSMASMSLHCSYYMGILRIGIFTIFGNQLGVSVFHDQNTGTFITVLSWLCPFMYLTTTMSSILSGLGKTSVTFFQNVWAMVIRLAFVLLAVPHSGILGYLWGMLASELALAVICFLAVKRQVLFQWDTANMVVKPVVLLLISIDIYLAFSHVITSLDRLPLFVEISVHVVLLSIYYVGFLLLFHKRKPLP